ncbi:hypothetical protein BOTBODRAFT_180977 [Botryobasidium botryosum FD-172 SS1]|uniref:Uncharacterized protein n=1 Tax=Botryobasidium botryosum (strain FD-172 SS1) TaxID=930990 RepID=A0A067LVB3_BOTB1|nr:hypothetical protein BOTBODRAFT_180977 [Botryobasidium botryosum FD-172 SS1]
MDEIKDSVKLASCVALGYDNLDIQFKTKNPTVESGTKQDDLKFVKKIWESSPLNDDREPQNVPAHKSVPKFIRMVELAHKYSIRDADPRNYLHLAYLDAVNCWECEGIRASEELGLRAWMLPELDLFTS